MREKRAPDGPPVQREIDTKEAAAIKGVNIGIDAARRRAKQSRPEHKY